MAAIPAKAGYFFCRTHDLGSIEELPAVAKMGTVGYEKGITGLL